MNRELPKIDVSKSMSELSVEIDGNPEEILFAEKTLQSYGLGKNVVGLWQENSSNLSFIIEKNLAAIKNLEQKHPGLCKTLAREFGIYNFGRYPEELLIKQYEQRENQDLPYGIILAGYADIAENPKWDNAFYDKDWTSVLSKLSKQLGTSCATRIGECGDLFKLNAFFQDLKQRYGKRHNISFGLLAAHGNENHFFLGVKNGTHSYLTVKDLKRPNFRDYKKLFTPNATLILDGCATGKEEGIALDISDSWGVDVIAPVGNGSIQDIKVSGPIDNLQFQASYSFGVETNNIWRPA